ncbi:hypothetical protein CXB51_027591 [Gossypium anomalum]|uniref:Uncharacterized protein n=1 Tax=Gossypium anomalum TaxID=47600 RepID=A0A8J6CRZ0_9ROSI|nr:hypothetical protein CXB51_027591 [Gossypium anomalum]
MLVDYRSRKEFVAGAGGNKRRGGGTHHRKENPKVSVRIVKEGMMVTMDFRCDRVRVWVDNYGIVKTTPHIG